MAYSRTPTQSTYQQKRMSFYRNSNIRRPGSDKDRQYLNVYLESETTPSTNEKTYWLRKRGGLRYAGTPQSYSAIRGTLSYEKAIYFVAGTSLIKYTGGSSYTVLGTIPNASTRVGMVVWNDNSGVEYLVIGNETSLYKYQLPSGPLTSVASGYPTPFLPEIQSIDGYIALVKAGTADIYTSQVEDMSTGEWDFINAELYPDSIVAFARYNNYLVALGRNSLEMFYDAGIETGSPLARNDSTVITVGCTSPRTVVQSETQLFWVGNAQEGQLGIWQLDTFKATEITTPYMRKVLSGPNMIPGNYQATMLRHAGRRFYVLTLADSTSDYAQIWAYDLEEKFWYQWDFGTYNNYIQYAGDLENGKTYLVSPKGLLMLDEFTYQDLGSDITCQWTTDPIDFDTFNRKAAHRLGLYGDIDGTAQEMEIAWSDDNYQTWSPYRTIAMAQGRPAIVNLGMFRRRAWRCRYVQNLPLRVGGLELYYNLMTN